MWVAFCAAVFISIGAFKVSMYKPVFNSNHFHHFYRQNDPLQIELVEELKPSRYSSRYIGSVKKVNDRDVTGRIILKIIQKSGKVGFRIGDVVTTLQPLNEIGGRRNPGEFDYRSWARKKGVYDQITAESNQVIRLERDHGNLQSKALIFRDAILNSLRKYKFSKENFSILSALLLGYRNELPNELVDQYRNAGAMHLLAISGLHIGVFLFLLNALLKPLDRLRKGPYIRMIFLLLSLWTYALLTGMSVSVVRSVLMFSVLCIGLICKKHSQLGQYMFVSMFVLLLINPLLVFDVGFQLSYTAVFFILWVSPMFERIWKPQSKFGKYFWSLIAVSVSAQLGVLPLCLFYFKQFSGLFLASSLVLIPILGLVLGLGIFLIVFDRLGVLNDECAQAYESLIGLMNEVIGWLNRFDFLVIDQVYFTIFLLIISYLGLFGMIRFFESGRMQFFKMVLICIIFIQAGIMLKKWQIKDSKELVVFHSSRNTHLGIRRGNRLEVYAVSEKEDFKFEKILSDFCKQYMNITSRIHKGRRHFYRVDATKVLLLDSELWKLNDEFEAEIVVLSHSPKFNLDRFLEKHNPKIIIADGSNYRSFVTRWEHSCRDAGVMFHNTAENGAFTLP